MSNIAGFNDLKKKKEQESEAKRNELFIGGLDQRGGGSGLAVLGPPPNTSNRRAPSNANNSTGSVFDNIVKQASEPNGQDSSEGSSDDGFRITLYSNGFIVDDGPFRDLDSPESRDFIATLERGEVPHELRQGGMNRNKPVEIKLMDKRSEEYVPPPPPAYIAFSGQGTTLRRDPSTSTGGEFSIEMLSDIEIPPVDDSQPSTTLQVRSHDGKKIKIKINQNSTIFQLAAIILKETNPNKSFVLSSGFPPVDLIDGSKSIKDAGLIGAVVIQKLM